MRILNALTAGFLAATLLAGTGAAETAKPETVAIVNARIFTSGTAGVVQRGHVVIVDGKIAAVGANIPVPSGARTIDGTGLTVTPGIVATNTTLGLDEVSGLDDTNDHTATHPGVTAAFDPQYGLNPHSSLIPVARMGGVTRAVVTPALGGGNNAAGLLFGGQAIAIHLGGGVDLLMEPGVAMLLDLGDRAADRIGGARGASFVALKAALGEARRQPMNLMFHHGGGEGEPKLSRADLAALRPVLDGTMPLLVRVSRASDILQTLKLAKEENLRVILSGAEEAWMVADAIAAAGVPVVVQPLENLPGSFEVMHSTLENAAKLHAAGVTVVIQGGRAGHYARTTRIAAGNAVANGLPHEVAVAAITAAPAKVFGLEGVGALEAGNAADLVVWSGDPLEPLTQVRHVFVAGDEMALDSRGQALARRYRALDRPLPLAYP